MAACVRTLALARFFGLICVMSEQPLGWWRPDGPLPVDPLAALHELTTPVVVVSTPAGPWVVPAGVAVLGGPAPTPDALPIIGYAPPLAPEHLGDGRFAATHGVRYPYMAGAMANGIASVDLVTALGQAGFLGSFGAAGLSLPRIDQAIATLQERLGDRPFAANLIHSPNEPRTEMGTAEIYLQRGLHLVEASAFLDLTPALIRYRCTGLSRSVDGQVHVPNRVIGKVSRIEVATKFLSPPPEKLLHELVSAGHLSTTEAELAAYIPVAQDVTVEADSGGHTDNRPAITLLPTILALRARLQAKFAYAEPLRIGLGGGIATPASAAAAFAMGAAYVVTGSINQACIESGSSDLVRQMLAEAEQADVMMAPAADMFEMGVKVQVLKRGTMFALRGAKLYELYRAYPSIEALPVIERQMIEKNYFRASLDEIWTQTADYFRHRDPSQLTRAERDPKHKMALVFRWYLGMGSRWANAGEPSRKLDYQVWCGPAMGAFNEWVKGTPLETPAQRRVVPVAHALLTGAAVILRQLALRLS
jgi:PfaD family protein